MPMIVMDAGYLPYALGFIGFALGAGAGWLIGDYRSRPKFPTTYKSAPFACSACGAVGRQGVEERLCPACGKRL